MRVRYAGMSALIGGACGLALAPIMVAIKYQTGWAVVPEPGWVAPFTRWLAPVFTSGPPTTLWSVYGMMYTAALLLMLPGVLLLWRHVRDGTGRWVSVGFWLVVAGYALVVPGDAIHSLTWHQNGLTIPTPGTNPVANTAYAAHMMGMNFIMVGSLLLGVTAVRQRLLASWLAWGLVLVFPSAVLASLTVLPTTPSGALWLFCLLMSGLGFSVATRRSWHLIAT